MNTSAVELDRAYMRRAVELAELGWGQTAPNPMVGAVVVRDGHVVGEGHHERYGAPHAEVGALSAAGDAARGATMFVSLEPCAHHGKTPPCVEAITRAGVARVVAATSDPSPDARGGAERLRAAGIAVSAGIEEAAARELNAPFFYALKSDRPWVTVKLAVSADGAIAGPTRAPRRLTGDVARAWGHRMRAGADAVAVGIETALADDPELTVRFAPAPRRAPARVVFDRRGRLPLDSKLVRTARKVPTIVVTDLAPAESAHALRAAGVEVLGSSDLASALIQLRERGIRSLLVEGGARLASAFLSDGLAHRLAIFDSPVVLGANAVPAFAAAADQFAYRGMLRVVAQRAFDADHLTVYDVESA